MLDLGPHLLESIRNKADQFALPIALVTAIVRVESRGRLTAWRAEPPYRYYWDVGRKRPFRAITAAERASESAPRDFPYFSSISSRDTEWWGQAASWGPMQVMGAVAREYGFASEFPELCSTLGMYYGCRHLDRLRDRFVADHGWVGVAAAYNAGSVRRLADGRFENQAYVDKLARAGVNFKTL
jgi:hypothetical protein